MDLLQSLILPGTEAYASWAASAFQQSGSHSHGLSDSTRRRDSVQDNSQPLPIQQRSHADGVAYESLGEDEADETAAIDETLLRTLLTAHVLSSTPIVAISHLQELSRRHTHFQSQRLCFFWYNYHYCDRNPANGTKPSRPCPHKHYLEEGQTNVKLSSFSRSWHKGPCDLEFCPLREGTIREEKRKVPVRHQDEPTRAEPKRLKISYDEDVTDVQAVDHSKATCFFWYHGRCARSLDPRQNYMCEHRHALTDPPSMVCPPPGYVHQKPCYLKWCPGDAEDVFSRMASKPNGNGTNEPDDNKDIKLRNTTEQKHSHPKKKALRKLAKEACFFWYHGCCQKRNKTTGESECPRRHEMTDPPRVAEPPPGYVHMEPCELELCPGDAKEGHEGDDFEKRYFESDVGAEVDVVSSGEVEQERDWYLGGFE